MRTFRPAAFALLLALTLGAPAAFAAPARASLLDQLRDFLVRLWSPEGCEIDPWGRCIQGAKPAPPHGPTTAAGCEWDPLGRCIQGARTTPPHTPAAGCEIDPWGRCLQGARSAVPQPPTPTAGCEIDPLGRCINQP